MQEKLINPLPENFKRLWLRYDESDATPNTYDKYFRHVLGLAYDSIKLAESYWADLQTLKEKYDILLKTKEENFRWHDFKTGDMK